MFDLRLSITLVVIATIGAIVRYLLLPWLKEKRAWFWVHKAVLAAEQVVKESGQGEVKKEMVIEFLQKYTKFKFNNEQWDVLIEAAVKEMNAIIKK
mgnify:CR=1 FL=1